jgi:hypothetical protein
MSDPARKVAIFTVEAVGTIPGDLPAAVLELLELQVRAAVDETLGGNLNGLTVSVDSSIGESKL